MNTVVILVCWAMALTWGVVVALFIKVHWPNNTPAGLTGILIAFIGGYGLAKFMGWYVKEDR